MPRKSNKRTKKYLNFKQKKLLKARLIRISMVIDDYVYKQKAISINDAKSYIKEVSKYKLQCEKDARSLQVIEKITRCMNAAIAEQQDEQGSNTNFENTFSENCPSPVYSLPDEDKAIMSQNAINPEIEAIETIDLSQDDDTDNCIQRNVQVDVEIHRAMSNLSIRETDDTQMLSTDCSQSILSDFNRNREEEIKKDALMTKPQEMLLKTTSCVTSNEHKGNNYDSQSILKDLNQDRTTVLSNTGTYKNRPVAKNFSTVSNKDNLANNNKKVIDIKKVNFDEVIHVIDLSKDDTENKQQKPEKKKKRQRKGNKGPKIDDIHQQKSSATVNLDKTLKRKKKTEQISKNVTTEFIKTSPASIDTRTRTVYHVFTNDIHTTVPLHKSNISVNESVHQKTQSTNICGLQYKNNTIYNKSMAKIYNVNIENDLSWVENIRYVREISTDEYDATAILEDSFWDNCALPNDWNEKDFDY